MKNTLLALMLGALCLVAAFGQNLAMESSGVLVLLAADGTWSLVTADEQVVTTPDGKAQLQRADGSLVTLSPTDAQMLSYVRSLLPATKTVTASTPAAADVIRVGWLGPLTGDSALWGQAEHNALMLMFDDINAQGGVSVAGKKYRLELDAYDDRGDSQEAVTVAQRLMAADHVVAILGPQGSGEAIPIAPIANATRTPVIATTATNPKVTIGHEGLNPFMFRTCFIDPYQGKVAASYAFAKLGKRRVALFYTSDDPYSSGLGGDFKAAFIKAGGKVVAEQSYLSGETDFRAQLAKIKASNPDLIFLPAYYNDVALIAKQARELGMKQVFFGGDGWPSDNLIELAGTALEGCYFVNHLSFTDPATKVFGDAYRARFGRAAELNSVLAHDATLMLLDAIARAGSLDGTAIAAALENCDIQTLSGRITIGKSTHNPEGKDAWIIKITDSDMVFVEKYAIRN